MTEDAAPNLSLHVDDEPLSTPDWTPRRSIGFTDAEHDRAVTLLQNRMEQLRRAEDLSRRAGHTFHRAVREVKECQRELAEAAARLQRMPSVVVASRVGSV